MVSLLDWVGLTCHAVTAPVHRPPAGIAGDPRRIHRPAADDRVSTPARYEPTRSSSPTPGKS
nr:hypothetical protein JVH1_4803 [Rhodococcus sp. JVH1]